MYVAGFRCAVIAALTSVVLASGVAESSAGQALQNGWANQDVGSPAIAGSASSTSAGFTITAGGTDIWGSSDQFHFVYQLVSGDVDVRARVDAITNSSSWAKTGVMIRGALTADAAHGFALVSAGRGTGFQRRTAAAGLSTHTAGPNVTPPEWVRLVRRGSTVSAYTSADGTTWALVGSDTIQLGAAAYVGLATTSHNASAATTASLSQVTVTPLGLPAGQKDADIGAVNVAGSAKYSSGTYQIHAGGADIWESADAFNFVYQQATGDIDVSVHVASIGNTSSWSKAGVMIRETLSAGAAHASAFLSPGHGHAFQRRPVTGGTSLSTAGSATAPPGWVRVTRAGSLVTAYQSADGKTWTAIGSDSVPMADTVYVGIAVTAHSTTAATDVTADTLVVKQTAAVNQPPVVSIASPANGTAFTAPASIAITANASDPENQLTKVAFYNGTTLLGTDTAAPYTFTWGSVPAGTYSLTAVAYDAGGLTTRSAPVSVTVAAGTSAPSGTTTTAPTGVIFTASPDDAVVTSYRLDVFAAGADPNTASPISSFDGGHPAPDSNNDITVSAASFFSALAPGNYALTVSAINSSGAGRSASIAFAR